MLVLERKERAFIEKVNSRCFCWVPAAILVVHQNGAPIWRLHTKLYKGAWNVSANNSETGVHKDLRLGQIVYILVFYNISFSWLLPLDSFQFIFLLRDSQNDSDWTNEESLAAVAAWFRNSRQNRQNFRQNTGARIQSFIVPSECGHRSHRSLDPVDLSALCAYAVFFFSIG